MMSIKEDSQKEIENFCRENRFFLLKYLVDEKGAKYKNKTLAS